MWGRGDQIWSWRHTGLDPLKFKSFLIQLSLLWTNIWKRTCFVELCLFISHGFPIFFVSHLTSPLQKVYEHHCWTLCTHAQDFPTRLYNTAWPSTKKPERQQHLCEYAPIEYTFCYVSETAVSFLVFTVQLNGHKNSVNASVKAFFLEWVFFHPYKIGCIRTCCRRLSQGFIWGSQSSNNFWYWRHIVW